MDLDRHLAGFGTFVEAHLRPARWAGIAVGAVVLLSWPSPTLSVLIWIVAFVAAYIGLLEWLRSKAPLAQAREAVLEDIADAQERAADRADAAALPAVPAPSTSAVVPSARSGDGTAVDGVSGGAAVAVMTAAPPEPALTPQVLTPEAISGLSDRLDLLVRLGAARDAGILSDEEFAREKGRLLTTQ